MNSITEAELIDNAKNGAVVFIQAVHSTTSEKGFHLFVRLTWKEGDLLLITQKKQPRLWTSVDRMLKHFEKNYSSVTELKIYLEGTKNATEQPTIPIPSTS